MVKEINSLLNLYLEVDEEILVEGKECGLRNIRTGEENNECNLVHDFLYELFSSNPEILKKHGFKEWRFNVHESKIEEIED